jgi:hypothetical protein
VKTGAEAETEIYRRGEGGGSPGNFHLHLYTIKSYNVFSSAGGKWEGVSPEISCSV